MSGKLSTASKLMGVSQVVMAMGGIFVVGCFLMGIYALIFQSAAMGLIMIGASVVGGWLVSLLTAALDATANGMFNSAMKDIDKE